MPESGNEAVQSPEVDRLLRARDGFLRAWKQGELPDLSGSILDIMAAYGSPKKAERAAAKMMTVIDGVAEKLPSGKIDAALQTDRGRLVLRNADPEDRAPTDPQLIFSSTSHPLEAIAHSGSLAADDLVRQMADAGENASIRLLCAVELTRFTPPQRKTLLPLLWQYILVHRDSNNRDEIVGVAAAIRKYVAIMPMDRMGELAALLETGHRAALPIDLQIEVAKMVYRNYEVHPALIVDPQPQLAQRLWEIVRSYIDPRVLLLDKCSAAASLAVEAIVAMRSPLAETAWRAASTCPYRWFAELVNDELDELHQKWESKNRDAAVWLANLRSKTLAAV
ncbi:MAG: hypothetical protein ACYC35_04900 [Pirellulales bacterium]